MMIPFQSIDNTSAINISKNPVMHSKTKHIPIKYHFLWEQVTKKNIRVEYVGTKEPVAYIFTKLLQGDNPKGRYPFPLMLRLMDSWYGLLVDG
jgi:hypothetical protein